MAGRIRIGACLTILGLGASLLVGAGAHAAPDPTARRETAVMVGPSCVVCAVTPVATSTDVPWGLVTLPDGSILYTERDRFDIIRIAPNGTRIVVGLVPGTDGAGGVTGLEISPTFATDHWLYIFHGTTPDDRIVRVRYVNGRLVVRSVQVLVKGIARDRFQSGGGRLRFGPDGKLYAGTSDARNGGGAPDRNSLNGKILRINPDGSIPADNPYGNAVWSTGHHNPQGLAFDAEGRLWATDTGASAMDELNLIRRRGNYGWPACEGTRGACANPAYTAPARTFPVGEAGGIAVAGGAVWMAALRGQRLYRIPPTGPAEEYLVGQYGPLRTVEPAPDGGLWLTTSDKEPNQVLHVTLGT